MKPKTKLHFEILKLKNKLPRLTKEHIAWANKKLFKYYAYKTKHKAVCFECGHAWAIETNVLVNILDLSCPKCKKVLEFNQSKSWSVREDGYFEVVTTCGGFQVIRMFHLDHYCKKGYKAHYGCMEVYQHWISPGGKTVILGMIANAMSSWQTGRTCWSYGSPMEIRSENDRYYQSYYESYPKKKIIPDIKRNGYKGKTYGYNKVRFFNLLLSNPKFETLLKAGQIEMLKNFNRIVYLPGNIQKTYTEKYWPQIKICIRNKYIIKDSTMWIDHLGALEYFHKDINSSKYICPYNLLVEHQILIRKRQRILDAEELEKKAKKIDKENAIYQLQKAKYFGLNFTDGTINIITLDHVREFFIEGRTLNHCVFQNEYYAKKDSLILSARKGNERLETIEISLKDYAVLQIHGNFHQNSKYHKDIVKLLKISIPEIKKINSVNKPKKIKIPS